MSEIVFKDFKGSVNKPEFEVVLRLARNEYKEVKRIVGVITDARNKLMSTFNRGRSEGFLTDRQERNLARMTNAADREGIEKINELFGDRLAVANDLVSFLNRFVPAGEELEYFDLEFLNIK